MSSLDNQGRTFDSRRGTLNYKSNTKEMLTRDEYKRIIKNQTRHQTPLGVGGVGSTIMSTREGGSYASQIGNTEKRANFEKSMSPKSNKSKTKSPRLADKARHQFALDLGNLPKENSQFTAAPLDSLRFRTDDQATKR